MDDAIDIYVIQPAAGAGALASVTAAELAVRLHLAWQSPYQAKCWPLVTCCELAFSVDGAA